ncbi:uncharacterized protein F5147DRAFT_650028 [Suillus discolor]|uniref:Uncharacterized protein n=1 Tax=Suillus discolor TaxID=1912936 RepID=A0A9P7FER8_9AGAM|nr:uncharacterized protein F5147DRAFT_650028 [Suillus discolor]KAG2114219.1 hypothetical protein F5147DRAFT_650028 [Suillus discolor]
MNPIPADWALATTHLASEYVSRQFCSIVGVMPKVLPPPKLDVVLLMACSNLAWHLADAYLNPDVLHMQETGINPWREQSLLERFLLVGQLMLEWPTVVLDKFGLIVLWYLPEAINETIQNDMMAATKMMSNHLCKSISRTAAKKEKWRTHESNFQTSEHGLTPGCINLSPGWFLQGHPAVLAAAALRVMHGSLYWSSLTTQLGLSLWADNNQFKDMGNCLRQWASSFTVLAVMCNHCSPLHRDSQSLAQWFDIITSIGNYGPVQMKLPNIGIEITYNSVRGIADMIGSWRRGAACHDLTPALGLQLLPHTWGEPMLHINGIWAHPTIQLYMGWARLHQPRWCCGPNRARPKANIRGLSPPVLQ